MNVFTRQKLWISVEDCFTGGSNPWRRIAKNWRLTSASHRALPTLRLVQPTQVAFEAEAPEPAAANGLSHLEIHREPLNRVADIPVVFPL